MVELEPLLRPADRAARPRKIVAEAVLALTARGIAAWAVERPWQTNANGSRRRPRGFSGGCDILGIVPPHGRFLAVAVPDLDAEGKPYRDQFPMLEAINACGGVAFFLTSLDFLASYANHLASGGRFAIRGDKVQLIEGGVDGDRGDDQPLPGEGEEGG